MPRGKKNEPVPETPDIKVGDRIVITEEGPRKGQHDAVVEIDHEDNIYRCAVFGWLKRDLFEVLDPTSNGVPPAPEPEKRAPSRRQAKKEADKAAKAAAEAEGSSEFKALVDGADAKVVLDGKSGGPKDEAMIKPPLEDLVKALARAQEKLNQAAIVKKRAVEDFKDAEGAFNATAAEIVQHYGQVEQLSMNLDGAAVSSARDVEEEEDEGDDEQIERVPVGAATGGVRDYRAGEGPE